jgi:hypothetical protein
VKQFAHFTGNTIFKHETVHVVGLMLKATSKCASSEDLDVIAVLILAHTDGEVRTDRCCVGAGEREASFVQLNEVPPSAIGENYSWITYETDAAFPLGIQTIEHKYCEVDAQLRSSKTRAVGGEIRGKHIGQQRLE